MTGRHALGTLSLACAFLLFALVPYLLPDNLLFLAGLTVVQALFALSWNFLFGYVGLASFGHAGFFAIGAYLMGACLRYDAGIPFLGLLIAAALAGGFTAWIVGIFALRRLAGIYLAVLTVALSEVLRIAIGYVEILGREDGLSNIPRPVIELGFASIDLSSSSAYYWFILLVSTAVTALLWWIVHSRFGRSFQIIHQDAERAAFVGLNVGRYRLAAFVISGAVAALAGALYSPWTRIVTLEEVNWLHSTQPILNTLLGGSGSFWGPIVGAVTFAALNYATRTYVGLSEVVVGGLLLGIILIAPTGIIGLLGKAAAYLRSRGSVRTDAQTAGAGTHG